MANPKRFHAHLIFLLENACMNWKRFRSFTSGVRQCEEAILHKLAFFSLPVSSSSSSSDGSASKQFSDISESESSKVTLSVDSSKLKSQAVDQKDTKPLKLNLIIFWQILLLEFDLFWETVEIILSGIAKLKSI